MKPVAFATAAVFAIHSPAHAFNIKDLVSLMETHGYTDIEVYRDEDTITVEADGEGLFRELVYDANTGALLEDFREFDADDHDDDDHDDDDEDEDVYDEEDDDVYDDDEDDLHDDDEDDDYDEDDDEDDEDDEDDDDEDDDDDEEDEDD